MKKDLINIYEIILGQFYFDSLSLVIWIQKRKKPNALLGNYFTLSLILAAKWMDQEYKDQRAA